MPANEVKQFTLNGDTIEVKDAAARSAMSTFSSDLSAIDGRVTTLEGLSRLTVSYNSSTETIAFSTL